MDMVFFNKNNDLGPLVSPVSPIQVKATQVDHLGRYWLYRQAWFAWKLGPSRWHFRLGGGGVKCKTDGYSTERGKIWKHIDYH